MANYEKVEEYVEKIMSLSWGCGCCGDDRHEIRPQVEEILKEFELKAREDEH